MTRHWLKEILLAFALGLVCTPMVAGAVFFTLSQTQSNSSQTEAGLQSNTIKAEANYTQEPVKSNDQTLQEYVASKTQQASPSTVIPDKKILNIDLIEQKYTLSCEMASLEMALKFYGFNVTQDSLFSQLPKAEPFKKELKNGKVIWGDPDKGFVGDEKGYMFTRKDGLKGGTGWGVNPGPVAALASKYVPGSSVKTQAGLIDLKSSIAQNKPIIFWHQRDDAAIKDEFKYLTPEGKEVAMTLNHVSLLIGYEKMPDGRFKYYFNDPEFGKLEMFEDEVQRIWGRYQNSIVIVG